MRRPHIHRCASCGDSLYVCHEPVWEDDTSRGCGNADMHDHEYCAACCVSVEDDVNQAMHNDDATAAAMWQEGR